MESYTFHVSIPNTGRVWRKVELRADQTLEDLHFAIQDAFDFDADHLYSFFMSGRAWDSSTEYTLPEDADLWDEDVDELEDEELDAADSEERYADEEALEPLEEDDMLGPEAYQALKAALGDGPAPESFDQMLSMVKDNDALRNELVNLMVARTGVPAAMADLIFRNADKLNTLTPEQFADQVLAFAPQEVRDEILESMFFGDMPAGDVRTTTLADLDLERGQTFLYLFDYGDEWRFKVRVHAINPNADTSVQYPRLVETVGDAPPQYPDWDDEVAWEGEEDAG